MDITLQDMISLYGEPRGKKGTNYYWQCPYCNDSGKDNMLFNPDTVRNDGCMGFVKCFADDNDSSNIVRDIFKSKQAQGYKPVYHNHVQKEKKIRNYWYCLYQDKFAEKLLNNERSLKYIEKKWGLTKETIELIGIGINTKKRYWILPIYYNSSLVGFEYRDAELKTGHDKKVWKKKDSPSCLAQISYSSKAEILIILEGFKDSYTFLQYLREIGQDQYYNILTPSMGVGTVVKLLQNFNFSQYKKVILYLDSDPYIWNEKKKKLWSDGQEVMKEAQKMFPFIEIKIMNCGCKDFNEHYLKCIKKGNV